MMYISTRGYDKKFTSAEAIKQGIAPDGGLFVPEEIPQLSRSEIMAMTEMTYPEISATVLAKYLTDFTYDELLDYTTQAYSEEKFGEKPAPLVQLNKYNPREYILELWHGPTAAFKDMALQLLPHLMTASAKKTGENRKICILTATSGDTGKAALEGFKDLPGTEVIVFYPSEGVSEAQKRQMITTEGNNVHVVAVNGCFDDAQSGVKAIFGDPEVAKILDEQGCVLSSANSINWGRLVPQIAYYVASYVELLKYEEFNFGEKMNVVYPLLYDDMGKALMIYLLPDQTEEALAKLNAQQKTWSEDMLKAAEVCTMRAVRSINELAEKIKIYDAGLDDRFVELSKAFVFAQFLKQTPGCEVVQVLFERQEDKDGLVIFSKEGKQYWVEFPEGLYDEVVSMFEDKVKKSSDTEYSLIDAGWSMKILADINKA